MESLLLGVLVGGIVGYLLSGPAIWLTIERREGNPFNWRMWFGFNTYYEWLQRNGGYQRERGKKWN